MSSRVKFYGLVGFLAAATTGTLGCDRAPMGVVSTVAEVQAVHSPLSANGQDVRGVRRLPVGAAVETGPDGRGRARLDDGTTIVIDRDTRFELTPKGAKLLSGRIFVQAASTARTELDLGSAIAVASGAIIALERKSDKTSVFCASGELTIRDAKGAEQRLQSGETASIAPDAVKIAPEAAFDDWTGGMAAPWSATGSPRRSLGEVWGRLGGIADGNPGSPLTIRASNIVARVVGEIASTEVRTTYFNAGASNVRGDFRMAIPKSATVSGFAIVRGDSTQTANLALADRTQFVAVPQDARLEWAGDGWLRGIVPSISPGATLTVVVSYSEWLSPAGGRIQYRYPLVGDSAPPRIGEFFATIDLSGAKPTTVAAGAGATVSGSTVTLRKSDFVPSADVVVEAAIPVDPLVARAYVSHAPPSAKGDYLVVRTETPPAPADAGVTISLVLDVSGSMEPALLDAGRALVEALIQGLGEKDRLIVLAADQSASPVGPDKIGPLTADRRKAILEALGKLSPGGATDLGRALERGADAIPRDAPAGMVIYVGDGWPTVGDVNVDSIEARLARREGGVPRLGAVAVGPLANRFALSSLVRSSGPLLEVSDRSDAARTAVELIAEALRPAVADVEIGFPVGVERVYPRGAHAMLAGSTIQAVGRPTRGLPASVNVRWRDQSGTHEESRKLVPQWVSAESEVRRQWAIARVEELAFKAAGREAATDVAVAEQLLTPWTAWTMGTGATYIPTPLETRILDLSAANDSPFSSMLATPNSNFGTLADPLNEPEEDPKPDDDAYRTALRRAAQRMIEEAGKQIRTCRDARVALRPDLGGALAIRVTVKPDGSVTKVSVNASSPADSDPLLNRCVEVVVQGLPFATFTLTGSLDVEYRFELPPPRALVGRKCSPTSELPLGLRRGIWLERLGRSSEADKLYLEARQSCELRNWTDKRALLELILSSVKDGVPRVNVAKKLALAGEEDAASLLRREAMRRARDPRELWAVRIALIGDEQVPVGTFRKQYRAANNDADRLTVVRKFLLLAPHHSGLRRRLFSLLEASGNKEALLSEVLHARQDPLADATLLADSAATLRRAGFEAEALRAYGELAERAPEDPSVRAFLGDRLRAEGWFDDASFAYAALESLVPDDPATILRLALAHAGAHRLDIATRLFTRLAQTGGRSGDASLGELGSRLAAVMISETLKGPSLLPPDRERLMRRALEIPWTRPSSIVLVSTPRLLYPVEVSIQRGPKDAREERKPDIAAPTLGISSFVLSRGDDSTLTITLRRPDALQPDAPVAVRIDILRPDPDLAHATLVTTTVNLASNGKKQEFSFDGKALTPKTSP